MNVSNDDSTLSAYLDGELSPPEREAVERALALDETLAESYRELTLNRDLVRSLARPPCPRDLAPEVVARVVRRGAGLRISPRSWMLGAASLATAASLLIAVAASFFHREHDRRTLAEGRSAAPALAKANTERELETLDRKTLSNAPNRRAFAAPTGPPPPSGSVFAPAPARPSVALRKEMRDEVESDRSAQPSGAGLAYQPFGLSKDAATERDREALAALLLDQPKVHRVLIFTDTLAPRAVDRIETIVRGLPRKDPELTRIHVLQGIIVDPQHPNEATVYAMAMDEPELKRLRERLKAEVGAAPAEESAPGADLLAQLSETGDIAVLSGEPLPRLLGEKPGELLAAKSIDPNAAAGETLSDAPAGASQPDRSAGGPGEQAERQGSRGSDAARERKRGEESVAGKFARRDVKEASPATDKDARVARADTATKLSGGVASAAPAAPDASPDLRRNISSRSLGRSKAEAAKNLQPGATVVLVWVTTREGRPPSQ